MNILLIGNGAREHVIAEALTRSSHKPQLLVIGKAKNPGIARISSEYCIGNYMDFDLVGNFIEGKNIDFAVIGPEDPLDAGIVDFLEQQGIPSVGPKKELAKLEASKSFTRDLLSKYSIAGNPKYKVCTEIGLIKPFIDEEIQGEFVVKADELCGGKGVLVQGDHFETEEEGIDCAASCIKKAGKVLIEEKLIGPEFSLMSFADGETVIDMPSVQDHKRAYEGDKGPNTGGMGSYSYPNHLPFIDEKDLEEAHNITVQVMHALEKGAGEKYKGIMYGGFMKTRNGVKLIEYNVRFGDPEAMNVLPLLETDFVDICLGIIDGTLKSMNVSFQKKATVCKYLVPEGYPENPLKGEQIHVDETYDTKAKLYYASIDEKEGNLYLGGSRSLAYVGIADDIDEAERMAEDAVMHAVKGPVFHRKDIGTKELIDERIAEVQGW